MSANVQSSSGYGVQLTSTLGEVVRRLFQRPRSNTIIVGADAGLRLLAMELIAAGKKVTLVKLKDEAGGKPETSSGMKIVYADALDEKALARAGAKRASCLVAATPDDPLNMNICRVGRDRFGVPLTITRMRMLNWVTSWARFGEAGMVRMAWPDAARAILGGVTPRANVSRVANANDLELVADVEVKSPVFVGRRTVDLPLRGCQAVALTRDGTLLPGFELEKLHGGDVLTLIGSKDAVDRSREIFTSL